MKKEALSPNITQTIDGVKGLAKTVAKNKVGRSAIIGGAGGALGNVVAGDDKQSVISRAASGAAVGGLTGAALGSMRKAPTGKTNSSTWGGGGPSKFAPQGVAAQAPLKSPNSSFNGQMAKMSSAFWDGFEKQAAGFEAGAGLRKGIDLIKNKATAVKNTTGKTLSNFNNANKLRAGWVKDEVSDAAKSLKNKTTGVVDSAKKEYKEFKGGLSGKTKTDLHHEDKVLSHRTSNQYGPSPKPPVMSTPQAPANSAPRAVSGVNTTAPKPDVKPAPANNQTTPMAVAKQPHHLQEWHKDVGIGLAGLGAGAAVGKATSKKKNEKTASMMLEYLK